MILYSYTICSVNSSAGRASDCSFEGRRFKPDLADIKNLVNSVGSVCQPHELKAVGSIPTRGTPCF